MIPEDEIIKVGIKMHALSLCFISAACFSAFIAVPIFCYTCCIVGMTVDGGCGPQKNLLKIIFKKHLWPLDSIVQA